MFYEQRITNAPNENIYHLAIESFNESSTYEKGLGVSYPSEQFVKEVILVNK